MMRKAMWAAAVLLAVTPLRATAQDVSVNFDKTYDFGKIKTFAVQVASQADDPFLEKAIVTSLTQALTSKGWTGADADKADALVELHGQSQTRRRLDAYGTGGGWRWGGGMGSAQLNDYKVGTLVVDIFDAKTKTILFRGIASDEMADKSEKNEKKADKAIGKMFKDFPPKTK